MQKHLKKILDIGEKNVEWVVVALGAFFFLYMTWTYMVAKPVSKSLAGTVVTPGTVDDYIDSTSGDALRKIMDVPDEKIPKFQVKDFSQAVSTALAMNWSHPAEIANVWDFQPVTINTDIVSPIPGANTPVAAVLVKALPVLPAASPMFMETGKTTVGVPPPPVPPPAPIPGVTPTPPPPPPLALAAMSPPTGTPNNLADIVWTTVVFAVPADPLIKQWTSCFGPSKPGDPWKLGGNQTPTQFLSVVAYRNEKQADGSWGPDVIVPYMWTNPVPVYPKPADKAGQLAYMGAVASLAGGVAAPRFADMASGPCGTVWRDPATEMVTLIAQAKTSLNGVAGANPAAIVPALPAPTPGSPAALAAAAALPLESSDPTIVKCEGFPPVVPPVAPQGFLNPAALPTSGGSPAIPATASAPAVPAVAPTPADILIYVNDATVKPGKTYRYRVAYTLANPVYNRADNLANANKAWADQFDLVSPVSSYTAEITAPLKTYFFCNEPGSAVNGDKLTFKFEVFAWSLGVWNKHTFEVNPGDQIGDTVGTTDFSTGYTYVDQRKHNNQNNQRSVVALMDGVGNAVLRDAELDFGSPDHKLKGQWTDAMTGMVAGTAVGGPHTGTLTPVTPGSTNNNNGGGGDNGGGPQNPDMPPP